MRIEDINQLSADRCQAEFIRCCGSTRWARKMTILRPFKNESALMDLAEREWRATSPSDWLEAFSHHPRIGSDKKEMEKKFSSTREWSSGEQQGVDGAASEILEKMVKLNIDYEKKFGYIFIVCATGKTAAEMLGLLESRINNKPDDEIKIAMEEQLKIMHIRIKKLLS